MCTKSRKNLQLLRFLNVKSAGRHLNVIRYIYTNVQNKKKRTQNCLCVRQQRKTKNNTKFAFAPTENEGVFTSNIYHPRN